jgi:hypothetical protein
VGNAADAIQGEGNPVELTIQASLPILRGNNTVSDDFHLETSVVNEHKAILYKIAASTTVVSHAT